MNGTDMLMIMSLTDKFTNKTIDNLCNFTLLYTAWQKMRLTMMDMMQMTRYVRQKKTLSSIENSHPKNMDGRVWFDDPFEIGS